MKTLILAGGRGTRLMPYTSVFPKPLMPVGDAPIIDLVLRQLRHASIREVVISVGHLAELIMAYCGDGSRYDLSITYVREHEPLGTIGPLGLLPAFDETCLVINGDVLTDLDYGALQRFHRERKAVATVACYQRPVKVDKGVVAIDQDGLITEWLEKPTYHYPVAMGLYVLEPSVLRVLPPGKQFDAPDLIRHLMEEGERVQAFEFDGYWLDIGVPADYDLALTDVEKVMSRVLHKQQGE